jgi:hypothetical protein
LVRASHYTQDGLRLSRISLTLKSAAHMLSSAAP